MKYDEKRIGALLRRQGYRLTPQRRAVLNVIALSREHLTPLGIYDKVQAKHPDIGLVTVYRTLELLAELGLLCEMHAGGNCRSYLMRGPDGHHHHLICSGCGAVVDFAYCELAEIENKLSKDTGFEIESHLLEFLGRCRDCR